MIPFGYDTKFEKKVKKIYSEFRNLIDASSLRLKVKAFTNSQKQPNKKVKSEIMNCYLLGRAVKAIFITPS